jgi:serine/threonine-protein kinase
MQINIQYQGKWRVKTVEATNLFIGRPNAGTPVQIDLTPDTTVSRIHARVWQQDGCWWVEDLKSKYGTRLNGHPILEPSPVTSSDTLQLGETTLRFDLPA